MPSHFETVLTREMLQINTSWDRKGFRKEMARQMKQLSVEIYSSAAHCFECPDCLDGAETVGTDREKEATTESGTRSHATLQKAHQVAQSIITRREHTRCFS